MNKKQGAAAASCILIAALALALWLSPANRSYTGQLFALDTYITMTAYGKNAEAAVREAESHILQREQLWSVNVEGSDIDRINRGAGTAVTVDSSTAQLVSFCREMYEKTDGAFDCTVYPLVRAWGFTTGEYRIPSQEEIDRLLTLKCCGELTADETTVTLPRGALDLGAVAKGQLSDDICAIMEKHGVKRAVIDLGGNIVTVGRKSLNRDWTVGIKSPDGSGMLGTVQVSDRCVITSGAYERYFDGPDGNRYGHIIDPATGKSADSGVLSVTVIGREGRLCDGLSTALFVMGEEKAAAYWQENGDFDFIMLCRDGILYVTQGVSFSGDSAYTLEVLTK